VAKVNADLVGKVVNLASRTAKFLEGEALCKDYPDDGGLFQFAADKGSVIAEAYERCDYNTAMREVMLLADRANKYVDDKQPWTLRKDSSKQEELRAVCTVSLNLFRQLAIYLAPVLPRLAAQTARLLNDDIGPGDWLKAASPLLGNRVNKFEHFMKRVELAQVTAMIEESKSPEASAAPPVPTDGPEALAKEPLTEQHCTYDDFVKVDMRVARVIAAEDVTDSNKLLRLTLSLGGDVRRNVFAGIKGVYQPADLIGRLVVCCANLEPRKMRFGISEGMVLAAGSGGNEIFILQPDSGAVPGQRVH
jgi:methionyl-tRNA synthetase